MDDLKDLENRKAFCELCIRILETVDDPRKEDALVEYRKQLSSIDGKINKLKPSNIVVGLKPAYLFGKTSE